MTDEACHRMQSLLITSSLDKAGFETVLRDIELPVVAYGVLRWVDLTIQPDDFFLSFTRHSLPVQFAVMDKISELHSDLHSVCLDIYMGLLLRSFDQHSAVHPFVLQRLVVLVCHGHVVPTLSRLATQAKSMAPTLMGSFFNMVRNRQRNEQPNTIAGTGVCARPGGLSKST
eukprot:m.135523 g.135523  ORF g.135523 m.135523 type:complete len:172 (+) comp13975_c0_seq11:2146-2661(+)